MHFTVLPPETNSAAMYSGAGTAPMLEAAAAWDGLASELGSAASSFNAVTSGLVDQAWQGAAAKAMTAAAAPCTGWLSAAAAHASGPRGRRARRSVSLSRPSRPRCIQWRWRPTAQFVRAGGDVELVWAQRAGDRRN